MALGLGTPVPDSHPGSCSGRWETRRWWHRRGAVPSPRDSRGALVLSQSSPWVWGEHRGTPDPHAR